ncbi:sugar phosphate isomerase/epimerase [Blastopirellula sp. JC732]|uniref:Sugar phosphate isomerase/epimerase n=1 Tax=Blastopirellula sediminis TaxID=2894196 RepID=A0A9X1MJR8_9BACT|nr:sugar phosphate isomerase/epimerase family protein [Blastopirellula sediminis]MCC9609212.1 sugar phosphate isomerase/epimerase [Blastopirellula sediminis]MCC9628011.1 sugar phosphate isomerase/epimerase [Blastopirellula sediminis]
MTHFDRRSFLKLSAAAAGAFALPTASLFADDAKAPFKISLAQWSLHKALKGNKLDNLDFAKVAKEECGIEAIEYVNQFFANKAKDEKYLGEMITRSDDLGVKRLLIMIDGEGPLGASDDAKRTQAVENHYKWVEAAKFLGCHSIRVNAQTDAKYEEGQKLAADGLRRLSEFAKPYDINVIVENHGGLSSNGEWLAGVMKTVDLPNCGTLPDFGNFHDYDRYKGVDETMPFAKAVSAKSHDFDADGNETRTDYFKMMEIVVKKHGYHGYVGVEYEGSKLPEVEGIVATRKLLERCAEKLG